MSRGKLTLNYLEHPIGMALMLLNGDLQKAVGQRELRLIRAISRLLHHGLWSMVHAYVLMPNGQAIDVYGAGDEAERLEEWSADWELNSRWCARGVYPAADQTFLLP